METTSILHAVVLGALQGVTEFLPVSSSAHLIIVSWLMDGQPLPLALNLALHFGTLCALLFYFWRDWYVMAERLVLRVTKKEKSFDSDILFPALVLGTIPAAVLGVLFEKKIEEYFHHPLTVCLPLAVVGVLLWWIDKQAPSERPLDGLKIKDGLLVGVAQSFALISGVSRSGSTIIAGRASKFTRADAARFSFLLGTPITAGAIVLKAKDILAHIGDPAFIVGTVTSAVVGMLTIGLLLRFLKRFGFGVFAIYRVLLAVVIAAMVLSGP